MRNEIRPTLILSVIGLLGGSAFLLPTPRFGGADNPSTPLQAILIDGRKGGRVFDGIGGVSAGASSRLLIDYPEPYRSQILDYLFKPHYGASLQHLKVEIGSDVDSTDGAEPSFARTRAEMQSPDLDRGYEWWLMEEAKKRNPAIILDSLAWGAPGWIGEGHFYSQDMADYSAKFVEGARSAHGLDIRYTGIWNERRHDSGYVELLHHTLLSQHLLTKIVCCDETPGENPWGIVTEIAQDPALQAAVAAVGVHYPHVHEHLTTPDAAQQSGKPLWASEDQGNPNGHLVFYVGANRWNVKGRALARLYNINYIEGKLTATEIWSPVTSYYDTLPAPRSGLMTANTPWSGHYELPSTLWVTAHTTQFAQPGWRYIDSACGYLRGNGTFVTLRSPSSGDYSVIIETTGATVSQPLSFRVTGGLAQGPVHVWETNATKTFEHVADLTLQNGAFSITPDPDSLYSLTTTTTGQARGTASPPSVKPFPFPFEENFAHTPSGQSPKYFADQDGAFEVWPCTGRPGRCLSQKITHLPISWGITPEPFTMLGDANWTDYEVSAHAMLTAPGEVSLLGRIDSADFFSDTRARWPSSYILVVSSTGDWQLLSAIFKQPTVTLASGQVSFPLNAWHRLTLRFAGSNVQATIDASQIASVTDGNHKNGMVGIGSGWNTAAFSDIAVRPIPKRN